MNSGIVGFVFGLLVGALSDAVLLQAFPPRLRSRKPPRRPSAAVGLVTAVLVLDTGGGAAGRWATGFVFAGIDPQQVVGWYAAALGLAAIPVVLILIGLQLVITGLEWRLDVQTLRQRTSK